MTMFMEVDDCRSCINKLQSDDIMQYHEALIGIKNAVIGSNRQKESVISQGIVPKLVSLISEKDTPVYIKLDAIVVVGSLAKGNAEQVRSLIFDYNIVWILLNQALETSSNKQIVEYSLCALRSIFQYSFAPVDLLYSNMTTLSHLINLAAPESTIETQACVSSIFVPLCHTSSEQMILCQVGTIPFLARMMSAPYACLQIPALKCLASMCFTNRFVSDTVCVTSFEGKSLPDVLTTLLSRIRDPEIQLASARCLTYIHRSGTLPSIDNRIVYKTLPCLARLCTNEFDENIRASAAETLAYLAEIDSHLQKIAAISNHLIASLSQLLQSSEALPKQGAFRCFASLGANDEDIRKRIIDMKGLMEKVLDGLGDESSDVRLASVRCLHSLSRSVHQLRTTFQDHSVWKPLMALLSGQPSNELLTVVTSTICNLLLEFSPAKEPMLDSGVVEMLCLLTENPDPALRLNGIWAIMNMAFQAEHHVRTKIINCLGFDRIMKLLNDSDTRVIMKTLGLLRNLLSKSKDIDDIMSEHSIEVIQAVNMILDCAHPDEVKEQALCIIGYIAASSQSKDYVMEDQKILERLKEFLSLKDSKLQGAALFVIGNLVHRVDSRSHDRYLKLVELQFINKLEEIYKNTPKDAENYNDIREVIDKCLYYS